jgi:alpha-beta hydrolase superfamily lysophospholipase
MAEHARRYGHLAETLNHAGYAVIAHDHRGHGAAGGESAPGHYADHHGWDKVTSDVGQVQSWINQRFRDANVVLLGHSMGSFIAQGYLMRDPARHKPSGQHSLSGLVLSGSSRDGTSKVAALRSIAAFEKLRQGPRGNSAIMRVMTFGTFARSVANRRTEFDWLSHDPAVVRDYQNDALCGFDCSNQLWSDLGGGLAQLHRRRALERVPKRLPILIVSGAEDPVGAFGKGPRKLAESYRRTGHTDVSCLIMPGMRHEPFNESNRDETKRRLLEWLNRLERNGL